MRTFLMGFVFGSVLTSALIDFACENRTENRCTFGIPTPMVAAQ